MSTLTHFNFPMNGPSVHLLMFHSLISILAQFNDNDDEWSLQKNILYKITSIGHWDDPCSRFARVILIYLSPKSVLPMAKLVDKVKEETEIYAKNGIDGLILENMHDLPYQLSTNHGPEICASLTRLCTECANVLGSLRHKILLGVQILAAANREALAVAHAAEFDFIRAEGFVFSHIADEGLMNACAGNLLRYRRHIGAENIAIIADIKKKHSSHAITADISVSETAKAAEFFLADGIILTGNSTGQEASADELKDIRSKCSLPVFIGSGINAENVEKFSDADGFIIGSYFKEEGIWLNEIDERKIVKLCEKVETMKRREIYN